MSTKLTLETLKTNLYNQHIKTLNNFFGNDEKKTLKFLSAVSYCVQNTPKLLECSQDTIISAFMKCAEYNLFPSSVSGEVYILPYYNKGKMEAQFQLGYKGIITLLNRSGISVYTDIVKQNDEFELSSGFDVNIIHKYPRSSRGEAEGVYAIAKIEGEKIIKYMAKDEVLEFKKFSKSANSDFSPWNPKNDPELNMWRKTAIKQLAKNLPLTEEISKAISDDNEEASITDYHKNAMIEQATRESTELASLLLPNNPTTWTNETQTLNNSETLPSTENLNNEPTNGTEQEPESSPEPDSKVSSEKKPQKEKNQPEVEKKE